MQKCVCMYMCVCELQARRTHLHIWLHVAHPAGQLWQHQQPLERGDAANQAVHHSSDLHICGCRQIHSDESQVLGTVKARFFDTLGDRPNLSQNRTV